MNAAIVSSSGDLMYVNKMKMEDVERIVGKKIPSANKIAASRFMCAGHFTCGAHPEKGPFLVWTTPAGKPFVMWSV